MEHTTPPTSRHRHTRLILAVTCLITAITPLTATDLETYLQAARTNSTDVRILELQLLNTRLSADIKEYEPEDQQGLAITAGEGTLRYDIEGEAFTIDPSMTLTWYDQDARVNLLGTTSIDLTDGSVTLSPSISFQKTLDTYEPNDYPSAITDDLTYAKTITRAEQVYQTGLLAIEQDVLQQLISILTLERTRSSLIYQIDKLQTTLDDDLRLSRVKKDTTTYARRAAEIESKRATLRSTEGQLDRRIAALEGDIGIPYSSITSISQPDLSYTPPVSGNTDVLLAATALELAREQLQDHLDQEAGQLLDDKSLALKFTGSYGMDYSPSTSSLSQSLQAGVSATLNTLTLETGVVASSNTLPSDAFSVYLKGAWYDPEEPETNEIDAMTLQTYQNSLTIAGIEYEQALLSFERAVEELDAKIADWYDSLESLMRDKNIAESALADAESARSRGVGTQTTLEDAEQELNLLGYDERILLIQGAQLEREIRSLLL